MSPRTDGSLARKVDRRVDVLVDPFRDGGAGGARGHHLGAPVPGDDGAGAAQVQTSRSAGCCPIQVKAASQATLMASTATGAVQVVSSRLTAPGLVKAKRSTCSSARGEPRPALRSRRWWR